MTRFKEQIGRKEKLVYKYLMGYDTRPDVTEKNLDIVCKISHQIAFIYATLVY